MHSPQQSNQKLRSLSFILGRWKGQGKTLGQPVIGSLEATMRCQNTFIEIQEKLFLPDGTLDYEDSAWVSFNNAQERLAVTHFMPPATIERKLAIINATGFYWWTVPAAPIVHFINQQKELRINVVLPDERVIGTMLYTRVI